MSLELKVSMQYCSRHTCHVGIYLSPACMHDAVRTSLMNSNDVVIGGAIDGAHFWDHVMDYTCNYIRDAGWVEAYDMDHEPNLRLCYAARFKGGR